jgi:hypothetical protein
MREENEMVCSLCLPKAREICELLPHHWLFENEGQWGLMASPGHGLEHTVLMFPDKPCPDPDPETIHENDEISTSSEQWVDKLYNWSETVKLAPEEGYNLVISCKKAGFGNSESDHILLMWLYDFAGKRLIEDINDEYELGNQVAQ